MTKEAENTPHRCNFHSSLASASQYGLWLSCHASPLNGLRSMAFTARPRLRLVWPPGGGTAECFLVALSLPQTTAINQVGLLRKPALGQQLWWVAVW